MQPSARNDTLRGPSAEIGSCHFCLRVSEVPRNSLLRPYCHLGSSVWCGIASLPSQEKKAVVFALKSSSGSRLSWTLANRLALLFQCLNFGVLDIFIKMCPAAILSVPVISRRCLLWRRTMRSGRLAAGGWRGVVDHSSSCGCRTLPGQWTGLRNEMLDRGTALPHSRIPRGPMSELQLGRAWRPGERSGAR